MTADHSTLSVVKLGGSLLKLPDVADRLIAFIDRWQIANPVVVVGGGSAADRVRDWQQRSGLSDAAAHDLAVDAMAMNSEQLSHLHSRLRLVLELPQSDRGGPQQQIAVLQSRAVLAATEAQLPTEQHLPKSWDVTSDSIAAWLAGHWHARHVYLLKSTGLPADMADRQADTAPAQPGPRGRMQRLAEHGLVDPAFVDYAVAVPSVFWCNLRNDALTLQTLSHRSPNGWQRTSDSRSSGC